MVVRPVIVCYSPLKVPLFVVRGSFRYVYDPIMFVVFFVEKS